MDCDKTWKIELLCLSGLSILACGWLNWLTDDERLASGTTLNFNRASAKMTPLLTWYWRVSGHQLKTMTAWVYPNIAITHQTGRIIVLNEYLSVSLLTGAMRAVTLIHYSKGAINQNNEIKKKEAKKLYACNMHIVAGWDCDCKQPIYTGNLIQGF